MIRKGQYVVGLLMAFLMVAIPMGVSAGTYTTAFGNHEIDYGNVWSLEDSQEFDGNIGEFVTLTNRDDVGVFQLGYVQAGLDKAEMRDAMLEGVKGKATNLSVIDSGQYDNVAYELDRTELRGTPVGVFSLVIDHGQTDGEVTIVLYMGAAESFAASMSSAQDTITVDGEPVFQGIDPASLQKQLGASGTTTTSSTSRSSSGTSTNSRSSRTSGSSNAGTSSRSRSTGTTRSSTSSSSSRRTSSSSGDTYTNPEWGYTVTYGPDWTKGSNAGDVSFSMDSPLTLLSFIGIDARGLDPETLWTAGRDRILEAADANATVLQETVDSGSVFVLLDTRSGPTALQLVETQSGNIVMVLMMTQGDMGTAIQAVQSSVQLDGMTLFDQYEG